jgi:hypothetical protein
MLGIALSTVYILSRFILIINKVDIIPMFPLFPMRKPRSKYINLPKATELAGGKARMGHGWSMLLINIIHKRKCRGWTQCLTAMTPSFLGGGDQKDQG